MYIFLWGDSWGFLAISLCASRSNCNSSILPLRCFNCSSSDEPVCCNLFRVVCLARIFSANCAHVSQQSSFYVQIATFDQCFLSQFDLEPFEQVLPFSCWVLLNSLTTECLSRSLPWLLLYQKFLSCQRDNLDWSAWLYIYIYAHYLERLQAVRELLMSICINYWALSDPKIPVEWTGMKGIPYLRFGQVSSERLLTQEILYIIGQIVCLLDCNSNCSNHTPHWPCPTGKAPECLVGACLGCCNTPINIYYILICQQCTASVASIHWFHGIL